MSRSRRQLTVWLHVLSSVGWMAAALVLFVLLAQAVGTDDPVRAHAATSMADVVDMRVLAPMANVSAFTGLVLAFGTAWGLVLHRWVLAKFAITLVQLYAGIFVLSGALRRAADTGVVPPAQLVGTVLMASAVAFQAWLSVAKPGGRTRWGTDRATNRPVKPPTAPAWVFVAGVLAPAADVATGVVVGFPMPGFSVLALTVVIGARVRARRAVSAPAVPARSA